MARDPRRQIALAILLIAVLAVVGILQYRWIGEISRAERDATRSRIAMSAGAVAGEFDRQVERALGWFGPGDGGPPSNPAEHLIRRYREWLDEAPHPEILSRVELAWRLSGGAASFERLSPKELRLEPVPWPGSLAFLREQLEEGDRARPPRPQPAPEGPMSIAPLGRPPQSLPAEGQPGPAAFIVVTLDEAALRAVLLPDLVRHHFPELDASGLVVLVRSRENPDQVIYTSDPSYSPGSSGVELALPFFPARAGLAAGEPAGPGSQARAPRPGFRAPRPPPIPASNDARPPRPSPIFSRNVDFNRSAEDPPPALERGPAGAQWEFEVYHRGGSLDAALARVRTRNLAAAGGILLVLAAAIALLLVTERRSHLLAGQQMEFIAGFTHELHTPLAAIRTAGQNLADGVVADPEQLARYGSMIEREGRRLSEMVDTILEFARMQAARPAQPRGPVDVSEVVRRALTGTRSLLEEREIDVETRLPSDLPPVLGDASALTDALRNLIENAAKYAGSARWIGIRAETQSGEMIVSVEDRGPGIGRDELPHLFEPFYRGRRGTTAGVPGSGLGLSIVDRIARAHGGRAVAANNAAGGARFSLQLPLAEREETR